LTLQTFPVVAILTKLFQVRTHSLFVKCILHEYDTGYLNGFVLCFVFLFYVFYVFYVYTTILSTMHVGADSIVHVGHVPPPHFYKWLGTVAREQKNSKQETEQTVLTIT